MRGLLLETSADSKTCEQKKRKLYSSHFYTEDRGSTFPRYVGKDVPDCSPSVPEGIAPQIYCLENLNHNIAIVLISGLPDRLRSWKTWVSLVFLNTK
jgi:hypothetical protein